eukprot:TRINITY_DN9279_c0_g1_i19.p1 TRINITY_DN9279_c0_g1~~TRINITY_DN9279_c0_g1_i19.p1  ORF type:complete len:103 (-),score=15.39 TRINITY_DN9279_c0_g1_i19:11-319(-)
MKLALQPTTSATSLFRVSGSLITAEVEGRVNGESKRETFKIPLQSIQTCFPNVARDVRGTNLILNDFPGGPDCLDPILNATLKIGRAVQQECRDRSRMPSSA